MLNGKKTFIAVGVSVALSSYLMAKAPYCPANAQGDFVVRSSASYGDYSLRECISIADDIGGTVVFEDDMTIVLSSVITINNDSIVVIDGEERNIVIDGNNSVKIFHDNNYGHIALNNLTIQDANSSDNGGAVDFGMGGSASIDSCTFTGNSTSADGGAIFSNINITIQNSTIAGNHADGVGGGLSIEDSTMGIKNTTISDNVSNSNGGGLSVDDVVLTIESSTISNNRANDDGGGIYSGYTTDVTIIDSTIYENYARHESGGIHFYYYGSSQYPELKNSILYGNTADQTDDANKINSLGYNVLGDISTLEGLKVGNVTQDPKLGPLQDNGGDTFTHALMRGSPAIDAGYSTIPLDQRGEARKGTPDIGSYEYQGGGANPAIIMYLLN